MTHAAESGSEDRPAASRSRHQRGKTAIDDVDHPPSITPAAVLRPLSGPLGTTDVAVN